MRPTVNIFLIGFMGSGKSWTGRRLADRLGWPFVDLDEAVEARAGKTISEIFATEGEVVFRRLEHEELLAAAAHPAPRVIATGGGAPCFHDGIDRMLENGIVCFLDPPVATLIARLTDERAHRPLLQDDAALRELIETRLAARRPVYERAHFIITDLGPLLAALSADVAPDGEG